MIPCQSPDHSIISHGNLRRTLSTSSVQANRPSKVYLSLFYYIAFHSFQATLTKLPSSIFSKWSKQLILCALINLTMSLPWKGTLSFSFLRTHQSSPSLTRSKLLLRIFLSKTRRVQIKYVIIRFIEKWNLHYNSPYEHC